MTVQCFLLRCFILYLSELLQAVSCQQDMVFDKLLGPQDYAH